VPHFIDSAKVFVKAGDGGNGCRAFRREAHVPRGGPSGGDGGKGGDVIFVADPQVGTLLDLTYRRHLRAERGGHGQGRDKYGHAGEDLVVKVPVGTLVYDEPTGDLICDLASSGEQHAVAKGGRGGLGNIHFATSTNQAPQRADPGEPGEERWIRLELKLLADVGLLGYPNAGKSTLISRVSRARPKIADYPFTTLEPNLGVVGMSGGRSFVLADIPGLIEGASEGAGLGHRFLRHVERTRVLVHVLTVDPDPHREPLGDFDRLNSELARFDPALAQRPQVVALNKMDLPDVRERCAEVTQALATRGIALHPISAATGEGLPALLEAVWKQLQHLPATQP
jgi:GTP-binding protein